MESTEPATGSDWKAFGLHRDPHQGGGLCPETQGVHSGQRLAELRGGNGHQMCGSVPAPVNRKEESDPFSGSSKCFDLLSGLEGCGGSPRTEVSLPSGHTGASGGALPTVTCPAQTTAHLFREPCPRRIHHHNQLSVHRASVGIVLYSPVSHLHPTSLGCHPGTLLPTQTPPYFGSTEVISARWVEHHHLLKERV